MEKNFDDIFNGVLGDDLIKDFQPKQQPKPTPVQSTTNQQQVNNINPTQQNNAVASQKQFLPVETQVLDNVMARITHKCEVQAIQFPENYNVNNEVQLAIQDIRSKGYLQTCTPESIEGALVEYAIQGLSISQKQAWFVKFGNNLTMLRSYFGDVAVCKRTNLIKDCKANVIYDGDEIEVDYDEKLNKIIKNHHTKFGNEDNAILGAYAFAERIDGTREYCVMTSKEIKENWKLSKGKNKETGVVAYQENFPQEASKRTVIRRLIKMILNTSVETNAYQKAIIESYNRTMSDEYIDADFSEDSISSMNEKINNYSNTDIVADDL